MVKNVGALAALIIGLAACGGAGSGSSTGSPGFVPLPPDYQADFVLAQPSGAPAANATIYQEAIGFACSPLCKLLVPTDATGNAHPMLISGETYCLSMTGYINESGALNPSVYDILTPGGGLYEQLPACISANQTTYNFVE